MSSPTHSKAARLFRDGTPGKAGKNCVVTVTREGVAMHLHGHHIATRYHDRAGVRRFSLAGWPGPTTRAYLRDAGVRVHQVRGVQYCAGVPLDASEWYEVRDGAQLIPVQTGGGQ